MRYKNQYSGIIFLSLVAKAAALKLLRLLHHHHPLLLLLYNRCVSRSRHIIESLCCSSRCGWYPVQAVRPQTSHQCRDPLLCQRVRGTKKKERKKSEARSPPWFWWGFVCVCVFICVSLVCLLLRRNVETLRAECWRTLIRWSWK